MQDAIAEYQRLERELQAAEFKSEVLHTAARQQAAVVNDIMDAYGVARKAMLAAISEAGRRETVEGPG